VNEHTDKRELFEQFARVGHALGSAPRLVMLDVLAQGERSVEQLAGAAGLPVANASQHLQVLRRAGLVATRREGARVHYRPAGDDVVSLWLSLCKVAEACLGDVERAARDYLGDEVEAIGRNELAERLRAGEVVVIDVRPRVEFAAGHIQGARSVPLDELEARLAEIPDDAEVVAYCRGPYCVYAHEAVRRLRAAGRQARRLEDGWPEWRLAGLPQETDAPTPGASRKERSG
jgi:rhodanese-related sulfurtransferase